MGEKIEKEYWGRPRDIKEKVANVPDSWLWKFVASERHQNDYRKLGTANNATLLIRASAVLSAIEDGEVFDEERSAAE